MRHIVSTLAFFLLVSAAIASEPNAYSLDVDVTPTQQTGVYMCKATVTDLASGDVIFAPAIQLKADSPAAASGADGDLSAEFTVSVDSAASRVTAQVRVTRAGKVIAAQKSSVAVR
jgi:hypothetical protein